MAEWFKAAVLKTVEDESPPRVRISPLPQKNEAHRRFVFYIDQIGQNCIAVTGSKTLVYAAYAKTHR